MSDKYNVRNEAETLAAELQVSGPNRLVILAALMEAFMAGHDGKTMVAPFTPSEARK